MSAFFGIDEHNAKDFIKNGMVCFPQYASGKLDIHGIVSPIKNEDIVFIKHSTTQLSLHIKAVGVVMSDFPSESHFGVCLPVKWVWQGEKTPENLDETLSLCGETLYEEHNILVQKEIIDLLPAKYRLPTQW